MARELSPVVAAKLAAQVYDVSSGDERQLRAFLSNRVFGESDSKKTILQADVGGRVFRSAKDAFGLCAKGSNGDLFLIFRGTTTANNKADFVTDARIGITRSETGHTVHVGFNHAFKSMLPEIRQFMVDAKITGTVHCIGHSLGGAVATLAADWVATTTSLPVQLYTFGQPRVGMAFFSYRLTKKLGIQNIHRVFHTTDPVPMVPVFPYVHNPLPGYGYSVLSENPIHSGEAHRMTLYVNHMENKKWADLTTSPPRYTHEDAIEGWLKSNFNSNPNSPTTFEWLENSLIWLLKKTLGNLTYSLQFAAMGVHTFADMAAWALSRGIELGGKGAEYVMLFVRKVMRVLGMKFQEGVTSLTRSFLRFLLETLTRRAYEMAMRAVRGLSGRA